MLSAILDMEHEPGLGICETLKAARDLFGTSGYPVDGWDLQRAAEHIVDPPLELAAVLHPDQWLDVLEAERGPGSVVLTTRPKRPLGSYQGTVLFRGDHPTVRVWTSTNIRPCNGGADWFGGLVRIVRILGGGPVEVGLDAVGFISRQRRAA